MTPAGARAVGNRAVPAFFAELRRLGFVEGENLLVERYSGGGQSNRYPELAREVVATKPDAIFTMTARMVRYFAEATTTIPIIAYTSDPVGNGHAASLARPGGNVTGVHAEPGFSITEKRFELLREVLPGLRTVALLMPEVAFSAPDGRRYAESAQRADVTIVPWGLTGLINGAEYERVFNLSAAAPVDAVLVPDAAENFAHRALIVRLAQQRRILGIYPSREYAEAGGVIAFGPDYAELLSYCAACVVRVFAGTPAGEIPIYQPQRFEVVINLQGANEIGITLPASLLVGADAVIE
jgi:putative ABC transport system substrate-binding protein